MSVRDVEDYFTKIAKDYKEMNSIIKDLEGTIDENSSKVAIQNVETIKSQINTLKENYMRISYIMFLLNKPVKKEKRERYIKSEQKRLNKIPKEHRLEGVLEEDKEVLNSLKSNLNK